MGSKSRKQETSLRTKKRDRYTEKRTEVRVLTLGDVCTTVCHRKGVRRNRWTNLVQRGLGRSLDSFGEN